MQKSSLLTTKKDAQIKCISTEGIDTNLLQINIALIGCGYWGPNLVRNFTKLREVKIDTLCDTVVSKTWTVARDYAPKAHIITDYHDILSNPQIHGVVIATPTALHFKIAQDALIAKKHIFVEKPLAMSVKECQELIKLAKQLNLVLMVGHIFRYNNAVQRIKEYIDDGLLGDILYIHSRRLNLGRIQTDINALWSFAPHDISILLYWIGEEPLKVTSKGFSYLKSDIEDVIFMTLKFPNGIETHSHLSWLNPKKVREMTIVGSKKMLIYDDVAIEGKIQIYDKSVKKKESSLIQYEQSYTDFQMKNQQSDILVPSLPFSEPLQLECQHFIDCIRSNTLPLTDGQEGLRVVRILEAAEQSLKQDGIQVELT